MVAVIFWKMHSLGNDYILVDNRSLQTTSEVAAILARKLCERRFSIGADGLLLLGNSTIANVKMNIFNADGSEAEMCGNGIRCFAKYSYENKITRETDFSIETLAGVKRIWLTIEGEEVTFVKVDMGVPELDRSKIPMIGNGTCIDVDLRVAGQKYAATCLSVGNPHCVIFVDDVDTFPVQRVGSKIENHKSFPKRTNVEFAQVLNRNELKLRVWERGCGETLACGSGACATVVVARMLGKVDEKVTVHLMGGDLEVEYAERLFLSGSAEKVFEGRLFD